jgi:hypothetical protein
MKRGLVAFVAAGLLALSMAGGVSAGEGKEYGEQPGFAKSSPCGEFHGAFGFYGKDNNLAGGTDGTTGERNSAKGCQRNK